MKISEKYCIDVGGNIRGLAFHPEGNILATCGDDDAIKLWDVKTGKKIRAFKGGDSVSDIAFSPDGKILASGEYRQIILRKVDTGEILNRLNLNELTLHYHSHVYAVAFSPNGYIVAGSDGDNRIAWFNVKTGVLIKALKRPHDELYDEINDLEFSPNGKILASCGEDTTVKLWEVNTGKLIRTLRNHTEDVCDIAFSPNGRILASGSRDDTIKLWDVETGKEICTLKGHNTIVTCVTFHPNGKILASGSWDHTIKLWDVGNGKEICTLNNHLYPNDGVESIVFSPDGQLLASDETIWHGDLPKKTNIEIVRLIKNPNPTEKS